MPANLIKLDSLLSELHPYNATLVAVSKTKPVEDILEVLNHGHLTFGENYAQEFIAKQPLLPDTIDWHFIGHLQSNKVKLIAPFVNLIHGVESLKLAREINKEAVKSDRKIDILLQVHIAEEETKFGLNYAETLALVEQICTSSMEGIHLRGLMGMASFSEDFNKVRKEFKGLRNLFEEAKSSLNTNHKIYFDTLSMGMSGDYKIALEEGSTMVRIGSAIFGGRT
ncbi:MAG TPA: YggS family pyridoxal phosphate-dependent enzyme [Bacteroidia bacterium]|nr:YggS family pyridoxal phosphate-dependent enzyme [Bacteroidia bacterium]